MVGPSQQRTTPADGTRPSKSVASSHQSRAGSARDGERSQGKKEESGRRGRQREKKATLYTSYSTFPLQPNSCSSNSSSAFQLQCINMYYNEANVDCNVPYAILVDNEPRTMGSVASEEEAD